MKVIIQLQYSLADSGVFHDVKNITQSSLHPTHQKFKKTDLTQPNPTHGWISSNPWPTLGWAVTARRAWVGPQPDQVPLPSSLYQTKCNSPHINCQCTNHLYCYIMVRCSVVIKGHQTWTINQGGWRTFLGLQCRPTVALEGIYRA